MLLFSVSLACSGMATGEDDTGPEAGARAGSSSSSLVIIATVTPVPAQAALTLETPEALQTAPANATLRPPGTATQAPGDTVTSAVSAGTADDPSNPDAASTPEVTASPSETLTSGTASPTPTPTETPSPTPVTPTIVPLPGMSSSETQIFVDHNEVRDDFGLPRLRTHDTLMDIARERAQAMASLGDMTHYNADGTTVFDMMAAEGYGYITGAENIHFNWGYSDQRSVHVAVEAWIDSPSHYAHMINPGLGRIGIGLAKASDGTVYYSVVFSD